MTAKTTMTTTLQILSLLLLLLSVLPTTQSYRIGDAVGILLRTSHTTGNAVSEAYRHQMPRFGVSTKTRFDISSLLHLDDLALLEDGNESGNDHKPLLQQQKHHDKLTSGEFKEEHLRLSLSFDEGFHHIPWFDVYSPHHSQMLTKLVITFVYSGSDGSIHAVHREIKYETLETLGPNRGNQGVTKIPKSFVVEYVWVEEADVDVQGGVLALFLGVLIVTLTSMVGVCTSSSEPRGGQRGGRLKSKTSLDVSSSVSEGFAKRL